MKIRQGADPHEIDPVVTATGVGTELDTELDPGVLDLDGMVHLSSMIILGGFALGGSVLTVRKLVEGIKETGVSAVFGEIGMTNSVTLALLSGAATAVCAKYSIWHGRRWRD